MSSFNLQILNGILLVVILIILLVICFKKNNERFRNKIRKKLKSHQNRCDYDDTFRLTRYRECCGNDEYKKRSDYVNESPKCKATKATLKSSELIKLKSLN